MPRFQRLSVTLIVRRICVFKRWGARCAELVTEANKGNEELAPPEPSPSLPSLPSVARPGLRNFTSFAPARWYERLWARCRTSRFTEQPPRVLHSNIAGDLDADSLPAVQLSNFGSFSLALCADRILISQGIQSVQELSPEQSQKVSLLSPSGLCSGRFLFTIWLSFRRRLRVKDLFVNLTQWIIEYGHQ
jgi:hypothetical protein